MRNLVLNLLLFGAASCATFVLGARPAAADQLRADQLRADQLRIEIPGARAALWLDLEQQRWWVEGYCDGGGRPFLHAETRGERVTVEFEDELRLELRHPFTSEQTFHLEIEGRQGRLRLRSSQGLGEMEMPVVIERHEDRAACSGERNRRK